MTTRIKHKIHGYLIVYGQEEIDRHLALGWELDVEKPTPTPASMPTQVHKQKHQALRYSDMIARNIK